MRKQALRIFFGVSLSVLLAVVSARADSGMNMRATIPFDFTVGDETLPAGTYTVAAINTHGLLMIRSEDYSRGKFINAYAKQAEESPWSAKLVFRKYGDLYFLAEVCANGAGQEVFKSRKERQVIRELRTHLAKGACEPELVYVAAN
jgi:hypothetical protein